MRRLIVLMVIAIIAFFLWIWYQLSIPGSGPVDFNSYSQTEQLDL